MKTAYKWFDFFLNLLLAAPVVFVLFAYFIIQEQIQNTNFLQAVPFHENIGVIIGVVITFILLLSFLFSVIYFIGGIVFIVFGMRKKEKYSLGIGKRMLIKGLVRGVITFILFFFFSLALSLFGVSIANSPSPKIINENITKGFPVQDLEVMHLRTWYNHNSDNAWSCDVTILNNNPKLIAINLFFKNATEKNNEDQINPGESKIISIYPDNDSQSPCSNVTITSAEIIHYGQ